MLKAKTKDELDELYKKALSAFADGDLDLDALGDGPSWKYIDLTDFEPANEAAFSLMDSWPTISAQLKLADALAEAIDVFHKESMGELGEDMPISMAEFGIRMKNALKAYQEAGE